MKAFCFFIFSILSIVPSKAQVDTLFNAATQHYSKGDYGEALKDYQQILNAGKTSAAVYFNMGNTYYKLDKIGPSIFYYNKALEISPNDKEIQNNLDYVKGRTVDLITAQPKTGFKHFIERLIATFQYNTWAILSVVFSFLFLILAAAYYFAVNSVYKRIFFSTGIIVLVVGILSVVFGFLQRNIQQSRSFAIIFAREVEVHAEPNHNASRVFTLHEGTKVRVEDNFNGYSKIELADGKKGWLKDDAIQNL